MKIIARLKHLTAALLLMLPLVNGQTAGTIALANSSLTRFTWFPYSTPQPVVFGVFWGTNQHELPWMTWTQLRWAEPGQLWPGSITASGLINAPSVYSIPETEPGQVVYLQIRGWLASYGNDWERARQQYGYDYAETAVLPVTLGAEGGPGALIWQPVGGTRIDRFYPLQFGRPLTPYNTVGYGTPSLVVDEGNQGSVDAIIPVRRHGSVVGGFPNLGIGESVVVVLSTSNITAMAGQDYVPANVAVRFDPGVTQQLVRIKLTADAFSEPDEQFSIHMHSGGTFAVPSYTPFIATIREARILSVRRAGGSSVITLRTAIGQPYALQVSADLSSWATLAGFANIIGDGTAMELTDPHTGCCEQRFYRIELLPF